MFLGFAQVIDDVGLFRFADDIIRALLRGQIDLQVFMRKNATGDGCDISCYRSDQTSLPNATINSFGPASLFELKRSLDSGGWAFEQTTFCTNPSLASRAQKKLEIAGRSDAHVCSGT